MMTAAPARADRLTRVGRLFIAVMMIIILEGAFRKWLSSSLTIPLVLGRDMVAVYIIFYAFAHGRMRRNGTFVLLAWSCCVAMWGMLQLMLGESAPGVLLIGLRFWLLYVWFAYAASVCMSEYDYRVAVKVLLWTLLLMGPLVILQHFSPAGARINTEIDTEEGDIFTVSRGIVRTTGTFSFTVGYTAFVALCSPLVLLMLESRKRTPKQRLFAVLVLGAFMAGTIVSGSRGTILLSGAILGLYLLGSVVLAPGKRKGIALFATIFIVLTLGLFLYLFQGAVEVTQERFEVASQSEDFVERFANTFIGEPQIYERFHWLGYGIGLGSNLATYVQSGDRTFFSLAETEPGRILLEGGLLGYVFIALKVSVGFVGTIKSVAQAFKTRTMFPVLLWLTLFIAIFTWTYIGQLTINAIAGVLLALGFLTFKYPKLRIFE